MYVSMDHDADSLLCGRLWSVPYIVMMMCMKYNLHVILLIHFMKGVITFYLVFIIVLQIMLLDSSLQLPPPVLVIPSPSGVLLGT